MFICGGPWHLSSFKQCSGPYFPLRMACLFSYIQYIQIHIFEFALFPHLYYKYTFWFWISFPKLQKCPFDTQMLINETAEFNSYPFAIYLTIILHIFSCRIPIPYTQILDIIESRCSNYCVSISLQYPNVWVQAVLKCEQFSTFTITFYVRLLYTVMSRTSGRNCVILSCSNSHDKTLTFTSLSHTLYIDSLGLQRRCSAEVHQEYCNYCYNCNCLSLLLVDF